MKTNAAAKIAVMIALWIGCMAPFVCGDQQPASAAAKPRIEVCFVLDTTGSMGGLIEGAKRKIWSIANQMIGAKPAPELKIALIGYRDRSDQYITKLFDLTDDIDVVHEKLMGFQADAGGDTPESVNQALDEAVHTISWSQDRSVLKIIFLVGDSPPHMDYREDVKYPVTCQRAVKRDIIINTVQCGENAQTTPIWQEIAKLSEGAYNAIGQTGDMVVRATPIDAEISALNVSIGGTLVAYGSVSERNHVAIKQKAAEAVAAPVAADRLEYNLRTGKAVQGSGELLDAVSRGDVKLENVKKEQLPENLQKLSQSELKAYVEKKRAERAGLQKKLNELLVKRDAYLEAETKRLDGNRKDAFDEKVAETIRSQAARKGINYEKKQK
jgi:Mg-chelatase subunit ChlD